MYKVGEKINGYTLLHKCGSGSFGEVFIAQGDFGETMALKIIPRNDSTVREIKGLQTYIKVSEKHPELLQIRFTKNLKRVFCYAMEPADNISGSEESYIPDTLENRLKSKIRLSAKETEQVILSLLDQLVILHSNGLIHRDVKPANIFWVHGKLKLGDIGLMSNEDTMTLTSGSPAFIPPAEYGFNSNSPATDLYAVGKVIYCCLSGKSVNEYPELDLSEDIENNGKHLYKALSIICSRQPNIKSAHELRAFLLERKNSEAPDDLSEGQTEHPPMEVIDSARPSLPGVIIPSGVNVLAPHGIGVAKAAATGLALAGVAAGIYKLVDVMVNGRRRDEQIDQLRHEIARNNYDHTEKSQELEMQIRMLENENRMLIDEMNKNRTTNLKREKQK